MEQPTKPHNQFNEKLKELDDKISDVELEISLLKEVNKKDTDPNNEKEFSERLSRIFELYDLLKKLKEERLFLQKSN